MAPTIVLLSPGLGEERAIWGERVVARAQAKALERAWPEARVLTLDHTGLLRRLPMRIDLLVSYYTGPSPAWRADDVARLVSGVTILAVVNHADLLEELSQIPVDGIVTNSRRGLGVLGRHRPAAYVPLGVDDEWGPVPPDPWYRADVVFLGSGGRGNKRPETTRRYLAPARTFDFDLWGGYWDRKYWAAAARAAGKVDDWHRFWRGPLPLDDIPRLYSSAGIVLGYHEDSQRRWGMWNNRVFEALACGAFLICDDAEGLREEFGEGLEITAGGDETARLIGHYLAHPAERRRRAEIGRRVVKERYTYSRWASSIREFYERLRRGKRAVSVPTGVERAGPPTPTAAPAEGPRG